MHYKESASTSNSIRMDAFQDLLAYIEPYVNEMQPKKGPG